MKKILILILSIALLITAITSVGCSPLEKSDFDLWKASESATDFNGDNVIDEKDYNIYTEYSAWLLSDNATDYNGDRKINYEDYSFYSEYSSWKISTVAYDYNNDQKIDLEDYKEYQAYKTWADSESAFDYDGNTKINEEDYFIYIDFTNWMESSSAYDFNDDEVIDKEDYFFYNEFSAWLLLEDAKDYNGDRKVNYEDFLYFNNYTVWKSSSLVFDFNADEKIDLEDYITYLEYTAWLKSEFAYNYDGNSKIDEEDYLFYITLEIPDVNKDGKVNGTDFELYNKNKDVAGYYTISNFTNSITDYYFMIGNLYVDDVDDLAEHFYFTYEYSGETTFNADKNLTKQLEGNTDLYNLLDTFKIARPSKNLMTLTFNIEGYLEGVDIVFYLIKVDGTTYHVEYTAELGEIDAEIEFDVNFEAYN